MSHGGPSDVDQQIFVLNIFSEYFSSPSLCPTSDADSGSGIGVTTDLLTFHWSTYLTFWLLPSHWLESRDNSEKGECPSDILSIVQLQSQISRNWDKPLGTCLELH